MKSVDKTINPKFRAFIAPFCSPNNGSKDSGAVMKRTDPLYYNSLQDESNKSHMKKPGVVDNLIQQGLMSNDGTVIPTNEEIVKNNRMMRQEAHQKKIVNEIEKRKKVRIERLLKEGRVNEIVFTKEGVFEVNPNIRSNVVTTTIRGGHSTAPPVGGKRKNTFSRRKKRESTEEGALDRKVSQSAFVGVTKKTPDRTKTLSSPSSDNVKSGLMVTIPTSTDTSPSKPPMAADILKIPPCVKETQGAAGVNLLPFPIGNPKLAKPSMSIKEALSSRDARLRAIKDAHRKYTDMSENVHFSKSAQAVTPKVYVSPKSSVKGYSAGDLHQQQQKRKKKRATVAIKKISSQVEICSSDNDDSYEVQIVSKLPKLVFRASSNKALPKKKSKIMRQDDLIKMQKETEQNLQKAIERMERKYNDICKIAGTTAAPSTCNEKSLRSCKTETGIQTLDANDNSKEEMLELLRELVVTPRNHLDSLLTLLGGELSKPDINYSKMLRYVHEYTDLEDYEILSLDEKKYHDEQNQLHLPKVIPESSPRKVPGEYDSKASGKDLQRTYDFISCTSSPAVASIAKHVVDDFVFDKNVMSATMVNKSATGTAANKKFEINNYTIEDGAHSLHKTMSFKQHGKPLSSSNRCDSLEDFSDSDSTSERENRATFRRTPSTAACHFNKVNGEVYHLYLRKDGTASFSMLSPKEKGASSLSTYLGSYRENENEKMTLVATPSSLSRRSSVNDIDLSMYASSSSLENISCSVDRIPGFNYYKYKKEDGTLFLTTVSPKVWGPSCPHSFMKVYHETKSGMLVPIKTVSTTSLVAAPDEDKLPSEVLRSSSSSSPLNKSEHLSKLQSNSSSSMEANPSESSDSSMIQQPLPNETDGCQDPSIDVLNLEETKSDNGARDNIEGVQRSASKKESVEVLLQENTTLNKAWIEFVLEAEVLQSSQEPVEGGDKPNPSN